MNSPGLRERKKQKTRWAIQEHAMRLFAENGYEATTVDQIAAAAEISPSTFFRYFPTKEELVIQDQYDDVLMAGLLAAPPELSPISAIRKVATETFNAMSPDDEAKLRQRSVLIYSVPALRARTYENIVGTIDMLRTALAQRTGRDRDELAVRVFAGAVVGALISVIELWFADANGPSLGALCGQVLGQLEEGLPL
jgi:AcrR family transcriptional regulator